MSALSELKSYKIFSYVHNLTSLKSKFTPTICCCTPTMHKEVKSLSLTHTKSWASSKCRQVARHFMHTNELSCFSMVKAYLGTLKVLNLKAYHETMASFHWSLVFTPIRQSSVMAHGILLMQAGSMILIWLTRRPKRAFLSAQSLTNLCLG
jgi:hypothetical protein